MEEIKVSWKEHDNATAFLFTWVISRLSTEAGTFTVSIGNVIRTGWPTESFLEITAYMEKILDAVAFLILVLQDWDGKKINSEGMSSHSRSGASPSHRMESHWTLLHVPTQPASPIVFINIPLFRF